MDKDDVLLLVLLFSVASLQAIMIQVAFQHGVEIQELNIKNNFMELENERLKFCYNHNIRPCE